jgi:type VI secretion system FHA domain protein
MALRLRVVGNLAKILGEGATRVFGVHGGTIGRSGENDWILPDPERYVSGRHARIEYRGGSWMLHDTSSNGTYLNGATDPISATGPYELRDGDRLRMGDFEFAVSIDASNDFPPEKSAIVAYDGLGQSSHTRQSTDGDIGASLNLDALLAADDDSGSRIKPVNAYGQVVELEPLEPRPRKIRRERDGSNSSASGLHKLSASGRHKLSASGLHKVSASGVHKASVSGLHRLSSAANASPVPPPPRSGGSSLLDDEHATQVPWNLATRRVEPLRNPVKNASPDSARGSESSQARAESGARAETSPAGAPSPATDLGGLQQLCRGAGIDPSSIPVHLQPQVLLIAGQVLREMVFGLMDVQQARTEMRNRFRIRQDGTAEGSPLSFSGGVEEALRRMFEQRGSRYLGPAEAVRETFREIKSHHQAVAAAMQTAYAEVLSRLDPTELQDRFDRGKKGSGLLGMANKGKYWDLYTEFYPSLGVAPKGELPHLFVEEFARAYEARMAEQASRRAVSRRDDDDDDRASA